MAEVPKQLASSSKSDYEEENPLAVKSDVVPEKASDVSSQQWTEGDVEAIHAKSEQQMKEENVAEESGQEMSEASSDTDMESGEETEDVSDIRHRMIVIK